MAKVGLWLRGARGKYAGGVLQKGENGTVVRENTTPANPQAKRQMYQRVAFATATKAMNFLLPVVGQSFEGANSKKVNKRKFIAKNATWLRLLYQQSEDIGDYMETMGYAIQKDQKTLVPNPYIISSGSLPGSSFFKMEKEYNNSDGTHIDFFKEIERKMVGVFTGKTYTASELWRGLFDIKPGQQVTFVAIMTRNEYPLEDGSHPLRYGKLLSKRLVLKRGSGDTITITEETQLSDITSVLYSLVDRSRSDVTFMNYLMGHLTWDPEDTGDLSSYFEIGDFANAGFTFQAAGFIISQYVGRQWMFSNCILTCLTSPSADVSSYPRACFGQLYKDALPSYLKADDSKDSDLYLEQGGDNNSYGDGTPVPTLPSYDLAQLPINQKTWVSMAGNELGMYLNSRLNDGEGILCGLYKNSADDDYIAIYPALSQNEEYIVVNKKGQRTGRTIPYEYEDNTFLVFGNIVRTYGYKVDEIVCEVPQDGENTTPVGFISTQNVFSLDDFDGLEINGDWGHRATLAQMQVGDTLAMFVSGIYTLVKLANHNGTLEYETYVLPCSPAQEDAAMKLDYEQEGSIITMSNTASCATEIINYPFDDFWLGLGQVPLPHDFDQEIRYLEDASVIPMYFAEY